MPLVTGAQPVSYDFFALGTSVRVAVVDPSALSVAAAAVRVEVDALDTACSRFRSDSELAAVNGARGRRLKVSTRFLEAVETALRAAAVTGGAVTPAVGAAVVAAGYDRDFMSMALDGPPLFLAARAVPDWRRIDVRWSDRTVQVPGDIRMDLDATAKALASDRAAAAARKAAGCGVLVEIGGDLAVAGEAPAGGWAVWVGETDSPAGDGQTVYVGDGGIATSGILLRRWRRGGRELHHLIDPGTGLPAAVTLRTATVAAATCVDANIGSTAALVAPDGALWIAQHNLPARLVSNSGEITTLCGWPAERVAA
jgi:thiamine biosynthesis lipoprotein